MAWTVRGIVRNRASKNMERSKQAMIASVRARLNFWGNKIITSIRSDETLFDHETGALKQSLWTRQIIRRGQAVQECGWSVPYGEVLEWGPATTKVWTIKPKATKALRFLVGNTVVWARKVVHKWTPAEQRPHFEPHVDDHYKAFVTDMAAIPAKVVRGR